MAEIKPNLIPILHNQTECTDCSIRRLALFHGVDEDALSWTQHYRSCQYKLAARQILYHETHNSDFMFTIYHGWLAIYKTLENGNRQILKIALPGDIIGYQADFEAPMTYSAISLTDSVLCAFPRSNMPEILRNNISIAKRLIELNTRDMQLCQNRLLAIGQHTATEKVAHCCAELFFRIKAIYSESEDNQIDCPISQEELGDMTGLTNIHVNRTLKQLREMGLIEKSAKKLKVNDIDGLCKLGGFDPATVHTHMLY